MRVQTGNTVTVFLEWLYIQSYTVRGEREFKGVSQIGEYFTLDLSNHTVCTNQYTPVVKCYEPFYRQYDFHEYLQSVTQENDVLVCLGGVVRVVNNESQKSGRH